MRLNDCSGQPVYSIQRATNRCANTNWVVAIWYVEAFPPRITERFCDAKAPDDPHVGEIATSEMGHGARGSAPYPRPVTHRQRTSMPTLVMSQTCKKT
jgi:hypothetical protein